MKFKLNEKNAGTIMGYIRNFFTSPVEMKAYQHIPEHLRTSFEKRHPIDRPFTKYSHPICDWHYYYKKKESWMKKPPILAIFNEGSDECIPFNSGTIFEFTGKEIKVKYKSGTSYDERPYSNIIIRKIEMGEEERLDRKIKELCHTIFLREKDFDSVEVDYSEEYSMTIHRSNYLTELESIWHSLVSYDNNFLKKMLLKGETEKVLKSFDEVDVVIKLGISKENNFKFLDSEDFNLYDILVKVGDEIKYECFTIRQAAKEVDTYFKNN